MKFYIINIYIIYYLVAAVSCWKFFTSLSDLILSDSPSQPEQIHSEYTYGNCKARGLIFFAHVHLDHMAVLGKLIVRGWLRIQRIPTCIVLRGTAYEADLFRSTAYAFQICVPRIVYCHSRRRTKYHYYEWYIPPDMIGGMNWDIYFYGPQNLHWQ